MSNTLLEDKKSSALLWVSGILSLALVVAALAVSSGQDAPAGRVERQGVGTLVAQWNDLGSQLVNAGVINQEKFLALYANQSNARQEAEKLLSRSYQGPLEITAENQAVVLNILWAFGLGNTNAVLEGPAMRGSQTGNLASTGGWSLAQGMAMSHYGKHGFVPLTAEQQKKVDEASRNIFRPCCNNSTSMPDCNHGMAMLGLLELMASEGASSAELYESALVAQRYWFADAYQKIDAYADQKQSTLSSQQALRAQYSSARGLAQITAELQTAPRPSSAGGSCSV